MKPLALTLCLSASIALSQVSDKILSVKTGEGKEGQPLTIQAEIVSTAQISQVLLAYRTLGASEYRQMEMSITGNTASATIPANEVVPLELEYYFILRIEGKAEAETYPMENPQDRPFRIQIAAKAAKDQEILFLSPDEGATVSSDDLLVSISLLRASTEVNKSATKILIDDRDVTSFAVVTDELITLVPENVTPPLPDGPHSLRIELYDTAGHLYHSKSLSYQQVSAAEAERLQTQLSYNVSATLEARNENIQKVSTPYDRANITASSQYGVLRLNGRLYVTNEEKDDRQPQNKYSIEAQTPWLRAGYGDAYPAFPSLIMSGKRLRGLTANLALGFFNVDFAQGEVTRKVDGDTLRTFFKKDIPAVQNDTARSPQTGSFAPYDTLGRVDSLGIWAEYRYGTFKRNLLAIRPSFGSGKNFQWGFSLLRAKDDVGSLERNGIVYGLNPQENIAAGSDLVIAFDDHRLELTGQGAASIYNKNIAKGDISDADIDSLYKYPTSPTQSQTDSVDKKRNDLRELRDKVSRFITVNQNLVPLSLDRLSSIMAYEGALALNYFDNYFKGGYIFRGAQYSSFGQTFIRNDIKGFNIFDRLRLMESQLFVSLGYENLQDNTDNSKAATTTFLNLNTTVSYFPRIDFPSVTVGYGQNKSSNGLASLDPSGPDSLRARSAIEDVTNRIFVQIGYTFTTGFRHNASLSLSTSNRDDKTYLNLDTRSTTVSGAVVTSWTGFLETSGGVSLNFNDIPVQDPANPGKFIVSKFNYTSILLGGRYRMLEDKLRLWASVGPTFGDVKRTTFDVGGEYFFYKNLSAAGQLSLLQNPGVTDVIWSIMLKYNL